MSCVFPSLVLVVEDGDLDVVFMMFLIRSKRSLRSCKIVKVKASCYKELTGA